MGAVEIERVTVKKSVIKIIVKTSEQLKDSLIS
jgi:hypothetical protein